MEGEVLDGWMDLYGDGEWEKSGLVMTSLILMQLLLVYTSFYEQSCTAV
jgi:hypothetical protein